VCLEAKLILIGSLSSSGKLRLAPEATKAIFANYSTALLSKAPAMKKIPNSKIGDRNKHVGRAFPSGLEKYRKKPKTFVISGA
jgi:hypothetical protein